LEPLSLWTWEEDPSPISRRTLLSYEEGTENDRIWNSERKTVVASRDVVFEGNHTEIPTQMSGSSD
jgi:hypothetical protein